MRLLNLEERVHMVVSPLLYYCDLMHLASYNKLNKKRRLQETIMYCVIVLDILWILVNYVINRFKNMTLNIYMRWFLWDYYYEHKCARQLCTSFIVNVNNWSILRHYIYYCGLVSGNIKFSMFVSLHVIEMLFQNTSNDTIFYLNNKNT